MYSNEKPGYRGASTSKSEKSLLESRMQKDGFEGGLPQGGSIEAGLERWAMPPRSVLSGHLKGYLGQTVL